MQAQSQSMVEFKAAFTRKNQVALWLLRWILDEAVRVRRNLAGRGSWVKT